MGERKRKLATVQREQHSPCSNGDSAETSIERFSLTYEISSLVKPSLFSEYTNWEVTGRYLSFPSSLGIIISSSNVNPYLYLWRSAYQKQNRFLTQQNDIDCNNQQEFPNVVSIFIPGIIHYTPSPPTHLFKTTRHLLQVDQTHLYFCRPGTRAPMQSVSIATSISNFVVRFTG
jgi:hypothetical protein